MILITGAGGKTGQAVIRALASGPEPLRAFARRVEQADEIRALGAQEVVTGDMRDPAAVQAAYQGVRAAYHLAPNMNPNEVEIAELAIAVARAAGLERFIYHSVLHPQVEAMPHHWLKLRVEEKLFTAGVPFTILQPGAYMQNVQGYMGSIRKGIYAMPYSVQARLSMVDLEDVATAAARVLTEPGHLGAIYELVGPQALSQLDVVEILSQGLGWKIEAQVQDRTNWEQHARATGMNPYAVNTLLKMFKYYEDYGFVGSPRVLEWLLGRVPTCFADFVARELKGA